MIHKPLAGIKVLDMTRVLAGPYCTMMLSNLGAEIIKIEEPNTGDDSRTYGPHINGESIYFLSVNRGKKSLVIDMKCSEGKKIFAKLVTQVDILVENFKAGTMEKFGFGYDILKTINPQLIYTAISGFGHTGPYSQRPAYDMIVQGMGGIMSITGEPDSNPVRVGTSIGDIAAGMFGAYGAIVALYARCSTGMGQKVDIAMLDCQIAILENAIAKTAALGIPPGPLGLKHPSISPFEAYRTKDSWIIAAAGNDRLFAELCHVTDNDHLICDPRFLSNAERNNNMQILSDLIQEKIKTKTTGEWIEIFNAHQIPAGPINTIDKLFHDPQVAIRNMLVEVEQPNIGKIKVAGNPVKMSGIPADEEIAKEYAPALGEQTREILMQYAGFSEKEAHAYACKYKC